MHGCEGGISILRKSPSEGMKGGISGSGLRDEACESRGKVKG